MKHTLWTNDVVHTSLAIYFISRHATFCKIIVQAKTPSVPSHDKCPDREDLNKPFDMSHTTGISTAAKPHLPAASAGPGLARPRYPSEYICKPGCRGPCRATYC